MDATRAENYLPWSRLSLLTIDHIVDGFIPAPKQPRKADDHQHLLLCKHKMPNNNCTCQVLQIQGMPLVIKQLAHQHLHVLLDCPLLQPATTVALHGVETMLLIMAAAAAVWLRFCSQIISIVSPPVAKTLMPAAWRTNTRNAQWVNS